MFPEIPRHQKLPRGLKRGNKEGACGHFLQSLDQGRMERKEGAAREEKTEKWGISLARGPGTIPSISKRLTVSSIC